jgi:hypothetical protein
MTVDPKALSRCIVLPDHRLEFREPLTVGRTHPHPKQDELDKIDLRNQPFNQQKL